MDADRSQPECEGCRRLEARVAELEALAKRLQELLEGKEREGKRQAAPFRKDKTAEVPKKPGRKSGDEHGPHAHRAIPQKIDERYSAPLPACCPHCQSHNVVKTTSDTQYQVEIVRKSVARQFDIERGFCDDCGRAVQGRHPLQTSDALGAAKVTLGPEAHAAMTLLNKQAGLPCGKISVFFETFFDIKISRSTVCRSVLRTSRKCRAAYDAIMADIRGSPFVVPDETGWRIGGENAWLHVFVGPHSTCYDIGDRSVATAERLLGLEWSGTLIHDGWSVYDHFTNAAHQQCLQHLQRRCEGLLETAHGGAARLPRQVLDLIDRAYALRRDWRDGKITTDDQAVQGLLLACQLEDVASGRFTNDANRRMAGHILKHVCEWFWFLIDPTIDATNWRAEQAIRPAVLIRKVWGGNRTPAGGEAQSILCSVLATLKQRGASAFNWLTRTLCSPSPISLLPAIGR
jgi:transposase